MDSQLVPKSPRLETLFVLQSLKDYLLMDSNKDWGSFTEWCRKVFSLWHSTVIQSPLNQLNLSDPLPREEISKSEIISIVSTITRSSNDDFPTLDTITSCLLLLRDEKMSLAKQRVFAIHPSELEKSLKLLKNCFLSVQFSPPTIGTTSEPEAEAIGYTLDRPPSTKYFDILGAVNPGDPFIDVEGEDKNMLVEENLILSLDVDERPCIEMKEELAEDPVKPEYVSEDVSTHSLTCASPEEISEFEPFPENHEWRRKMLTVLREISLHKKGYIFTRVVRDSDAPGYSEIVKRPVSLGSIKLGIRDRKLCSTPQVHKELLLMILNALSYNSPESSVHQSALEVLSLIDMLFAKLYREENIPIKAEGLVRFPKEDLFSDEQSELFKKKEKTLPQDPQDTSRRSMIVKEDDQKTRPLENSSRSSSNHKPSLSRRSKPLSFKQLELSFLHESVPLKEPDVPSGKQHDVHDNVAISGGSSAEKTSNVKAKRSSTRISSRSSVEEEPSSNIIASTVKSKRETPKAPPVDTKKRKIAPKSEINIRQTPSSGTKKKP